MRRNTSSFPGSASISFGPGPMPTAIKALIAANVVMFLFQQVVEGSLLWLGLIPSAVLGEFRVWQLATYMFLHGGVFHLLFNMLALWMFGTELERMWGTRFFVRFYMVTGIGAAALTVALSLLPFAATEQLYQALIVGASGAIYGLLLAYGLYFPDRPIYLYFVFPIRAKYFVMIIGALAFYSSLAGSSGIASATHLGGLLVGYLLLKGTGTRVHPLAELKYRYLKWRINRVRRRFDVYSGGRADDWDRRVH